VSNANLFGKVCFTRLTVPISILVSNLISFAIQFSLFLFFMGYFSLQNFPIYRNWTILLTPVLVLMMVGLGLGFGIITSSLTTKYCDLRFLVHFGVQLPMYATPVFYPASAIPARFKNLIIANPMIPIVETFRYAFLEVGSVNLADLLYSFGFMFAIMILGVLLFNRIEATFTDTV